MSADSGSRIIETARLLIRPVLLRDAEETAALLTADVAANLLTWKSPMTLDEARARIRDSVQLRRKQMAVEFAVLLRDTGKLVGWIGLTQKKASAAQLGYWLGAPYHNRGLTSEAARAAVPAGAQLLGVSRVNALVAEDNLASIGVLRNAGLQKARRDPVEIQVEDSTRRYEAYYVIIRP